MFISLKDQVSPKFPQGVKVLIRPKCVMILVILAYSEYFRHSPHVFFVHKRGREKPKQLSEKQF